MTIGEILQEHGTAIAEVMFDKGMHCVGCCGASFESLEQGCKAHGMDDEQVDKLVEDLTNSLTYQLCGQILSARFGDPGAWTSFLTTLSVQASIS